MSPSTRSKPASQRSPEAGAKPGKPADANDAEAEDVHEERDEGAPAPGRPVEIELEPSRQRAAGWAVFGLLLGVLLVWQLGTVAVWVGYLLIAIGAYRAFQLIQSFRNAPGTIVVSDREVVLPRGLHMTQPVKVPPADVTAAYFLRKSVPWNRASPVLVVELGPRAIAYPRDWFASEAEQRRVIHALRRLMREPAEATAAAAT